MSKMLNKYMMLAAGMAAIASGDKSVYTGEPKLHQEFKESEKLTGFTQVKGRRHLSKSKRKKLNKKNHNES